MAVNESIRRQALQVAGNLSKQLFTPLVTRFDEFSGSYYLKILDALSKIPGQESRVVRLPSSRENEFTLLQSILYILEQDILGLELPHITAINLLNKEPADVYHLMELFEEIAAAFSLDTCGSPTSDDLVHNIAALNISSTSKRHSTSDDRTQEANCGKATEKKANVTVIGNKQCQTETCHFGGTCRVCSSCQRKANDVEDEVLLSEYWRNLERGPGWSSRENLTAAEETKKRLAAHHGLAVLKHKPTPLRFESRPVSMDASTERTGNITRRLATTRGKTDAFIPSMTAKVSSFAPTNRENDTMFLEVLRRSGKRSQSKVLQYLDSQVTALELLKNQVSSWQRQQDQLLHKAAIQRAKGARRDRKISDLRIKRYVDEYLVGHERRLQAADLTAVTKGTAVLDTSGKELVMKNYLRDVTEVRRQEAVKELQRMRLRRRLEAETAQFQADAEQARQGFRSRAEHLHDDYGDSVERFPMPPVG